jgi:hypothetical protein
VSYSYFDFAIDDLELALLDLGVVFSHEHYQSKIIKKDSEKILLVYKERFLKNFIGTASVVGIRYFYENSKYGVEVFYGKLENTTIAALKEFAGDILILPLIAKGLHSLSMYRKAQKFSVVIAHRHRKEVKK